LPFTVSASHDERPLKARHDNLRTDQKPNQFYQTLRPVATCVFNIAVVNQVWVAKHQY